MAEKERKDIQSEIIQKNKQAEQLKEEWPYTKEKEEKVFNKELEIAKLIVQNYPTKEREIKKIEDVWVNNILEYLMDYKYRIGDFQGTLDICFYVKENFPYNHSAIRALWKMAEINHRMGKYKEALQLYQQVIDYEPQIGYPAFAESAQSAARQMAEIKREISGLTPEVIKAYHDAKDEETLYLIKNYWDCEGKPLEIFLSIRNMRMEKEEDWAKRAELCQKIVSLYPECKLAGYAQFHLGYYYLLHLSRQPKNIEEKKRLRDTGVGYMRRVIRSYPDAVFPNQDPPSWQKGQSIPLTAQLYIALAYEGYWTREIAELSKAIEEYHTLIEQFSKASPEVQKTFDYDLKMCAYVSMLSIYMSGGFPYSTYYSFGWSGNNEKQVYFNPDNARELIDILLKISNQKFLIEMGYFGETHPEALINLAFLEKMAGKDKTAIEILEKIIKDFPKSWCGQRDSGAVNPYFCDALTAIIKIINDDKSAIEECRKFAEGDYYFDIKGCAYFEMAEIYQKLGNYKDAIETYQKVKNEFADINLGGEDVNLGMLADGEIQKLKRK